jgi:hypothetical protein
VSSSTEEASASSRKLAVEPVLATRRGDGERDYAIPLLRTTSFALLRSSHFGHTLLPSFYSVPLEHGEGRSPHGPEIFNDSAMAQFLVKGDCPTAAPTRVLDRMKMSPDSPGRAHRFRQRFWRPLGRPEQEFRQAPSCSWQIGCRASDESISMTGCELSTSSAVLPRHRLSKVVVDSVQAPSPPEISTTLSRPKSYTGRAKRSTE